MGNHYCLCLVLFLPVNVEVRSQILMNRTAGASAPLCNSWNAHPGILALPQKLGSRPEAAGLPATCDHPAGHRKRSAWASPENPKQIHRQAALAGRFAGNQYVLVTFLHAVSCTRGPNWTSPAKSTGFSAASEARLRSAGAVIGATLIGAANYSVRARRRCD